MPLFKGLGKTRFTQFLATISILGFLSILLINVAGVDIDLQVDALVFVVLGIGLMISGGWRLFFQRFKNGLTRAETNQVVTVVVGFASLLVGILDLPAFMVQFNWMSGVKVIISAIAIIVIAVEAWFGGSR
jgi:hypothetical protein